MALKRLNLVFKEKFIFLDQRYYKFANCYIIVSLYNVFDQMKNRYQKTSKAAGFKSFELSSRKITQLI